MKTVKHCALIAALLLQASVLAHGGAQHLMGTVKAVGEKSLTVETKNRQSLKVVFDENTKYERDGTPATSNELMVGERVVVHTATKKGSREPVAVLVKLASGPSGAQAKTAKDGGSPDTGTASPDAG